MWKRLQKQVQGAPVAQRKQRSHRKNGRDKDSLNEKVGADVWSPLPDKSFISFDHVSIVFASHNLKGCIDIINAGRLKP